MNGERKLLEVADNGDYSVGGIVQEFLELVGITSIESSFLFGRLERLQEDLSEAIKEIKRFRESY